MINQILSSGKILYLTKNQFNCFLIFLFLGLINGLFFLIIKNLFNKTKIKNITKNNIFLKKFIKKSIIFLFFCLFFIIFYYFLIIFNFGQFAIAPLFAYVLGSICPYLSTRKSVDFS